MSLGLGDFVRRANGKRVLLIGDLILDRYVYGDADRISPEAPVPILRTRERADAAGGAASVAAGLRALGVDVFVCGLAGRDRHGRRLCELLEQMGVDCGGVVQSDDRPTTTKTRLVGLAQHRHRQQLLRLDEESTELLSAAEFDAIRSHAMRLVGDVDAVCIEDYDKGLITPELVAAIVTEARRTGKRVLVDPARLADYGRYADATVITPNRSELAMVCGYESTDHGDIAKAAEELRASINAQAVVVTLDREGALIAEVGKTWRHVPTRPRSVYDNTGAGDAVLAMLAGAMVGGADLDAAVKLANIAGGLEVEKFGCVPISADEVLAELRIADRRELGKLRTLDELINELSLRRDRGETVVLTNGCYDLLHAGHVDFLTRCHEEGSILVVAVNSDESVRSLGKGDNRPFNNAADRAHVLAGLDAVDYVVVFEEQDPARVVERIRPDVLVKGEDWADRGVVGREVVESYGGRVKLLPLLDGYSTTALVARIQNVDAAANAS